jgi:hypothetical protein
MGELQLGVRWTIGDVSAEGFEALRLSIWGCHRIFGDAASYAVCFNGIRRELLSEALGALPCQLELHDSTLELPLWLRERLAPNLGQGVAWKFAPLHMFEERHELSLDNDCILWDMPAALREWLARRDSCLIAEDVRAGFGIFSQDCGGAPRNSGIRGVPPHYPLRRVLMELLSRHAERLQSELDEHGLQVAAMSHVRPAGVVRLDEVSICSPFPPHLQVLGSCGAHFVGLNARELPWSYYGRPASELTREHWQYHLPELYQRVGLPPSAAV